ncbi:MAG: PorV/PorQ family protein [Elusimicrobiota bacterium]|jgi:hypothetical protein
MPDKIRIAGCVGRIALVWAVLAALPAQASDQAGSPGSYLDFAGGPRVSGMGRAYVGLAEGADAVMVNPAGLGFLRPNVLGLMHTQTPESAMLDYAGYAQPIYRMGAVGLSFIRLDSGVLPQTDEYNVRVGEFRDVEQTITGAYGIAAKPWLSVGGAFKFSQQSLGGVSANGWGMDIGALAKFKRRYQAGLRVQNVMAPKLGYETASDSFPRLVTLGLSGKWLDRFVLSADLEKGIGAKQDVSWRLGAEGTFWKVAKLRAGFDFGMMEFSIGLGYLWGRSDVGYSMASNQYGMAQKAGLDYSFGGYDLAMSANPESFSPVGLKKRTTFTIRMTHATPIDSWALQIRNQQNDVVYRVLGSGTPPGELTWDGKTSYGMNVPAGIYRCTMSVTDRDGRVEITPIQNVNVQYGTPLDNLEMSLH